MVGVIIKVNTIKEQDPLSHPLLYVIVVINMKLRLIKARDHVAATSVCASYTTH